MILDTVVAAVASQLHQQAELGVQVVQQDAVPDAGPAHRGIWVQIPEVTVVFADLKSSTALNADYGAKVAARAYTYFSRTMTVILEAFQVRYVDVQGDGIFGLFSGKGSRFLAAACAITMKPNLRQWLQSGSGGTVPPRGNSRRGLESIVANCWCGNWESSERA